MPQVMTAADYANKDLADYAGDGVYVINQQPDIVLRANHHADPTDTIALEPAVFECVLRIAKRWGYLTPHLMDHLGYVPKEG